jgi:hypothetical protein
MCWKCSVMLPVVFEQQVFVAAAAASLCVQMG